MVRCFSAGAIFLALATSATEVAAADGIPITTELGESGAVPFHGPSIFDEEEPVVVSSPSAAISYELPAGIKVRDVEVSPAGDEVALIIEDGSRHQRIAFWQFSSESFSRTVDVPLGTRITSLTWHPRGKVLFLLATGASRSRILKIDPSNPSFVPATVFASDKRLRRLVVGPRPFQIESPDKPEFRLFFGEQLPGGTYALRTVSENGTVLYTVVGPRADPEDPGHTYDESANTTNAPSALPLGFHPAGDILTWEDHAGCLKKTFYVSDNWGETQPFGEKCAGGAAYTRNGAAILKWQPKTSGLLLHGLIDGTDQVVLGEYSWRVLT